jgi:hypothetical protein
MFGDIPKGEETGKLATPQPHSVHPKTSQWIEGKVRIIVPMAEVAPFGSGFRRFQKMFVTYLGCHLEATDSEFQYTLSSFFSSFQIVSTRFQWGGGGLQKWKTRIQLHVQLFRSPMGSI